MSSLSDDPELNTTMPSRPYLPVRGPLGRLHPPHPRPTVSLDPRPVVVPILSSVVGFPIVVFALICALRRRAIRHRRRHHLQEMQRGHRSATLDVPTRERMSYFSGGSSPEASTRDPLPFESTTFASPPPPLKSSLAVAKSPSSRTNHVTFVTPAATLDPASTMRVEAVLHSIAESVMAGVVDVNGTTWKNENLQTIEGGVVADVPEAPR